MSAEIIAFPLKPRPRTIPIEVRDSTDDWFETAMRAATARVFGQQQNDGPPSDSPTDAA